MQEHQELLSLLKSRKLESIRQLRTWADASITVMNTSMRGRSGHGFIRRQESNDITHICVALEFVKISRMTIDFISIYEKAQRTCRREILALCFIL